MLLRSRRTLAGPGIGGDVPPSSRGVNTGSGIGLEGNCHSVPAASIGFPGISVNGMARNPESGPPGGAKCRVSQCQSAGSTSGSGQTLRRRPSDVNGFFYSNDFNGLAMAIPA